ncbi:hypothetical protein GCM10018781_42140 [Kitasatospora indigofera]|uniref:Uncharacterized protein n=1 Tax=Kitasatospora indigofera TaxID=67307 RepID=A0A919KWM4_9ACTN|nr:hypothetical protein GCM10018781_42140 [Kitasatospora indigofera]
MGSGSPAPEVNRRSDEDPKAALVTVVVAVELFPPALPTLLFSRVFTLAFVLVR